MGTTIKWIFMVYICFMNLLGIIVMGVDKSKAKKHKYRIPEKALFTVSLLGGSLGTWAGMYIFRHKTKHWYFVVGMPAIFIFHLILLWKLPMLGI